MALSEDLVAVQFEWKEDKKERKKERKRKFLFLLNTPLFNCYVVGFSSLFVEDSLFFNAIINMLMKIKSSDVDNEDGQSQGLDVSIFRE